MMVLVTGASGFIGRNLVRALNQAGHQVRSVSRRDGVDFCQMLHAHDWLAHLDGIDAVINCVGIIGQSGQQRFAPLHTQAPSALFQACVQLNIRHVIEISALGADASAFSHYHLSKLAADDYLRSLEVDWFVLRPSLIYGKGGQSAKLFMRLASLPIVPMVGDGQQKIQPVHISDVVHAVLNCLDSAESRQTIDVVGPEVFTFTQWLTLMRSALGLPKPRFVHVPVQLALASTWVGRYFSPLLQPDNVRMLQTGYLASAVPLSQLLGRMPQAVQSNLFFTDTQLVESTT